MIADGVCSVHREPYVMYDRGRFIEKRCLACQRARQSATHFGGPRCRRGHLKTPWSWRTYGGKVRCVSCVRGRQV